MTQSMTHLDVEDVLSSIRRLVSDGPIEQPTEGSAGLFVLTPAHRVSDHDIIQQDHSEETVVGGLDLAQPPVDLNAIADAVVDAVETHYDNEEAAIEAATAAFLGETLEASAAPGPTEDTPAEPPVVLTDRVTEEPEEEFAAPDDFAQEEDSLAPMFTDKTVLEQRIADLEQAVGRVSDDFEPDGSEPQEQHQPKLNFLKRYRERFEVIDGDGIDRDAPMDVQPEPEFAPEPEPQPEVTEAPAEPVHDPVFVPDQRSSDAPLNLGEVATFSHTPRRFEPAPADLPEEPNEPEMTAVVEAESQDLVDGNEEFFVDEEVLRALVSDIVKNELQGRLGERITRNVRRMVRHEIEKALSLKSLE